MGTGQVSRNILLVLLAPGLLLAQSAAETADVEPAGIAPNGGAPLAGDPGSGQDKRIFGVLPNYRTADGSLPFKPITAKQKFTIARKDTFDYPSYVLAAAFAGLSQADNSNASFGQGLKGYARRYASAVADQDLGNFLTEAIYPSLLHEDPGAKILPYMLSGGTDAKAFQRLGMRCFGFSPLRLPADLDFTALFHGVDERVPVDALEFGTRVLDRFLRNA